MTDNTLGDFAGQDVIDSRDLYERLNDLEELLAIEEGDGEKMDADDRAELEELKALQDETKGYAGDNWRDGVTFIRDSYFEEYAEEFADDIGAIDSNARWPLNHIDWKAAADELRQDYTEVEIRGISYQYR